VAVGRRGPPEGGQPPGQLVPLDGVRGEVDRVPVGVPRPGVVPRAPQQFRAGGVERRVAGDGVVGR
jgi:hypothetical protein